MTPSNSFLVPCEEAFVKTADGPFHRGSVWGEPDIDIAADLIRLVAEKPSHALAIGQSGKRTVLEQLSPARVAERIKDCFAGR
jgi:hypothetical protein